MNYEELYRNLLPLEKKMKDSITAVQKLHKSMGKDTEAGDLKNLSRNLLAASEALKEQAAIVEQLQNQVESFDSKEYYESGEFVTQMLDFCKEKDVDVTGEYPVGCRESGCIFGSETFLLCSPSKLCADGESRKRPFDEGAI